MYHGPQLTSEVMAFAKEHEKTMEHCQQLDHLLEKINTALSPLEQAKIITDLTALEKKFTKELEPHYFNEEEALFPILGVHIGSNTGIIPDILDEHNKLRTLFQELQVAMDLLQDGWSTVHTEGLNKTASTFITFMKGHIAKEDKELYPVVENTLSLEEKRQVFYKLYANIKPTP